MTNNIGFMKVNNGFIAKTGLKPVTYLIWAHNFNHHEGYPQISFRYAIRSYYRG